MYDYQLEKDEEVLIISDDGLLKKGNDISNVSVIITNKRFLILELPIDLEGFRFGRSINYPIKKEVIFDTPIQSIMSIEYQDNFVKYILDSTNFFYLKDDKIYNYMLKELKNK